MIRRAEERGAIKPGDTLIEATSGNTGIALAMAAAIRGYRMLLIMPEDLCIERAQTMKAFGAELILTPRSGGMEYARDLAEQMQKDGKGVVLDQFANPDNPRIHYETAGPEIWKDTGGGITHFVSAMGTTGTITGVSRFLREARRCGSSARSRGGLAPGHPQVAAGVLAEDLRPRCGGRARPGLQADAEEMARRLAREEGIFGGISAAGACWVALQLAATGARRDDRLRRLRPGRPLPFHRGVSRMPAAARSARTVRPALAPISLGEDGGPRSACAAPPAAGPTGRTRRRCSPR